uniref:Rab-GAP TBC domain-containing protein n=1 Tax=Arcella intermedia TaxID=1963864 RepID=A0A6B2L4B7_9EUKA
MYYLELHKSPFPSGLYNNLKNQPVNPKVLMDIEKDLPRTFPLHPVFISKEGTDALRRILLAFSIRHPQIGYTQGMNFLAGFLLLLMEEELAFKVLIIIVEYFIPQYYMTDMPGLHADQMVLAILVRDELPRLHQHLQSLQLDLGVITYRWFLCLFINTLPYSTVLRIWDILFCKGTSTIIITAFALLKLMEDKLCSQSFLTTDFVDKSCLSYFNWDLLVKTMFSSPTLVKKVTGLQKAARKVKEDELKDSILKQVANSISFCNYGGVVHYHEKFTMVAIRSTIGINQFTALLPPKLSIFGTDKDILQRLFNMFDKLGYGYLTFEAYMTGLDVIFSGTEQKKIEILFKIFDLNDDGFIDATELEFILSWQNRMMKINDPHVITATIEALMQKFDEDKDGKLDKDQFIQVLKKQAFFIHLLDDLKLLQ